VNQATAAAIEVLAQDPGADELLHDIEERWTLN